MMLERGTKADYSTLNRWVIEYAPLFEKEFRKNHKKKTGSSWRMDDTYIKIKGVWNYLYRTVDKEGDTIDFMLSKHLDEAYAKAFLQRQLDQMDCLRKLRLIKVVLLNRQKYLLGRSRMLMMESLSLGTKHALLYYLAYSVGVLACFFAIMSIICSSR